MKNLSLPLLYKKPHFFQGLKVVPVICIGVFLLASCSEKKASANKQQEVENTTTYKSQTIPAEQHQQKTLLCQINGAGWYYTEVQCRKILSTDYNPREKFVLNFKNTDSEAAENITLMYNANTLNLEYVDAAIQAPNDEAGVRAFFGIKGYTDTELAQIKDIGILTNVAAESISGTASFTIARNSKGIFQNELDEDIAVTDLQFTNIPFEDESDRR